MTQDDLYDLKFVSRLFDEMASTYGLVNMLSSFGFCRRWRSQCLRAVEIQKGAKVLDLMTGMGELCPEIGKMVGDDGAILALDLSPVMCDRASRQISSSHNGRPGILKADALNSPIKEGSIDFVVSTFGLKTFSAEQISELGKQVHHVLRPGGQFSFLEISIPDSRWLKLPFLAYLKFIIPWIGRLALGNPDNYSMLGVYTTRFGDCRQAHDRFVQAGLRVRFRSFFFGCATGITGYKPE